MTDETEIPKETEGDRFELLLQLMLKADDPGKVALSFIFAGLLTDAAFGKADKEWAESRVAQLIAEAKGLGNGR